MYGYIILLRLQSKWLSNNEYLSLLFQGMRYYKSIGLGFKTPKEAIEGSYVDKKCPFTGNVSIRGRILKAMVISTKMKRTIVIRRDYLQYVSKYRRFEKRHKNVSVHCSPCFLNVREGDVVTVGQCRPLAKTVRFNVLEHQPSVNKVSQRRMLYSEFFVRRTAFFCITTAKD